MLYDIQGIIVYDIKFLPDERGEVIKLCPPPFSVKDVYCTTVRNKAIKAFHGYKTKSIFWSCIRGLVKFVMIDARLSSPTHGVAETLYLGDHSAYSIYVPPGVYSGFQGISQNDAIMVVQASEPYGQIDRQSIDYFGYDWTMKNG